MDLGDDILLPAAKRCVLAEEGPKIRAVRFHDLRHGAATLMLDAGVDPATLSATLGHSRVGFTLDTYVHASQRNLDDATSRLARMLSLSES